MINTCRHTLQALLAFGADLSARDEKGQSALHKACTLGNPRLVRLLVKEAEGGRLPGGLATLLHTTDDTGNSPLLVCVESGSRESAQVRRGRHHNSALSWQVLLERGAEVNCSNENGVMPLHVACTVGSLQIVEILIENKAAINCLTKNFQTPLHLASANNKYKIVRFLLENGAKLERRDKESCTPLLVAAQQGREKSLVVLLDSGALTTVLNKEDKSAVYLATEQNNLECLTILLSQPGIKNVIEVNDRYDNTPLHIACREGFLSVALALLNAGAQIDNKNEDEQELRDVILSYYIL